ncbi:MAG: sulfurtransferase TusA family protein [Lachnospiraceae bacterium]|nr:sulfurtransferase TusA family protein [Lachnospiraceae bacterium]
MSFLDARGLSCPEPVIMIKNAITSNDSHYEIMVDNRTSVENITRFGEHNGFKVSCTVKDDDFVLSLDK